MVDRAPQPADDDNSTAQQRRRLVWKLAGAGLLVLGLLVVLLLLACVLWIPKWLYPPLTETDLRGVSDAAKVQELKGARLKLQNDARTTLLQGLGAVLVLTGAGIGASVTLRQIRETATANRNQLQLSEQGQVTDRYTRAVSSLATRRPRSGSARCTPLRAWPRTTPSTVRPSSTCSARICACRTPHRLEPTRTQPTQSRR